MNEILLYTSAGEVKSGDKLVDAAKQRFARTVLSVETINDSVHITIDAPGLKDRKKIVILSLYEQVSVWRMS